MKRKLVKRYKKKRGFTLIELLAVILILGIIALIAIPTVTSVVEQSRKGAFENTSRNIIEAIQTKCAIELLDDNGITDLYLFNSGTVKPSLDIKGNLPDEGYARVDEKCDVSIYVKNNKYGISKKYDEMDLSVESIESIDLYPEFFDNYSEFYGYIIKSDYDPNTFGLPSDSILVGGMGYGVFSDNLSGVMGEFGCLKNVQNHSYEDIKKFINNIKKNGENMLSENSYYDYYIYDDNLCFIGGLTGLFEEGGYTKDTFKEYVESIIFSAEGSYIIQYIKK